MKTNLEIMEEDNSNVLVVSHAGACLHFLSQVVSEDRVNLEKKLGFKNCIILKYSYEEGEFELVEVIRTLPID